MYAVIKNNNRFEVAIRDEDSTYGWKTFKTFDSTEKAQDEVDELNNKLILFAKKIYGEAVLSKSGSHEFMSKNDLARFALTAAQVFDLIAHDKETEVQNRAFETWR